MWQVGSHICISVSETNVSPMLAQWFVDVLVACFVLTLGKEPFINLLCSTQYCQMTWTCSENVSLLSFCDKLSLCKDNADVFIVFLFMYLHKLTNEMNFGESLFILKRTGRSSSFLTFVQSSGKKQLLFGSFWQNSIRIVLFKLDCCLTSCQCPNSWITNSGREIKTYKSPCNCLVSLEMILVGY